MFALQLAPRRRNVAAHGQFAPDVALEPAVQLAELKRLGAALGLALTVDDARGHGVAHQLVQQRALQVEHALREREIGGHRHAAPERVAALLEVGCEAPLQGRRHREAVGRKQAARQLRQRLALRADRHRLQRVAARTGEVAQGAHTADLARQHADRAGRVVDRIAERAAQHGVILVRRQRPRFLALEQVARDRQALHSEGQRVAAQVEHQGVRVDAEAVVFVGTERQFRLAAARGNALELGALAALAIGCDGLVSVFDGPVIVRAEGGLKRCDHRVAGARQVHRRVLHHRARQGMVAGEFRVGQLRVGVDARSAEVVAQAKRVANLVHRHVLQVVEHELLCLRAVRVDVATRRVHVERIAELLGGLVGVQAGVRIERFITQR